MLAAAASLQTATAAQFIIDDNLVAAMLVSLVGTLAPCTYVSIRHVSIPQELCELIDVDAQCVRQRVNGAVQTEGAIHLQVCKARNLQRHKH